MTANGSTAVSIKITHKRVTHTHYIKDLVAQYFLGHIEGKTVVINKDGDFNNNKIDIYETEKFTKRKHVFNNTEECLKTVIYEQTNPKYKNFIQVFLE